jgi:hypothetical protein
VTSDSEPWIMVSAASASSASDASLPILMVKVHQQNQAVKRIGPKDR